MQVLQRPSATDRREPDLSDGPFDGRHRHLEDRASIDIWAAIAPISGSAPDTLEKIRGVPEIIVHGDNDPTVNVSGSRTMVAKLKELGVEHKYIEVPGGLHSDVVAPNIAAIVEFFDAHRKAPKPTSQP